MKSIVIGSNGFVADELLQLLQKEGHELYGCSRSGNKHGALLTAAHFRQIDITDKTNISTFIHDCEPSFVFLLAAEMSREMAKIRQCIDTNVLGVLNVLESLKNNPSTRLIYLCTGELYTGKVPYTEDSPLQPKSPYSLSKYQGTLLVQYYQQFHDLDAVILRPSTIYGPGQNGPMFIPSAISCLSKGEIFSMTGGEQTRDFVYNADIAKAMLSAAMHPRAKGELFNISGGEEIPISDIAELICMFTNQPPSLLDKSRPYRINEQMRYVLDNAKAKKVLGWKPTTQLQEGLKKTVQWHTSHVAEH